MLREGRTPHPQSEKTREVWGTMAFFLLSWLEDRRCHRERCEEWGKQHPADKMPRITRHAVCTLSWIQAADGKRWQKGGVSIFAIFIGASQTLLFQGCVDIRPQGRFWSSRYRMGWSLCISSKPAKWCQRCWVPVIPNYLGEQGSRAFPPRAVVGMVWMRWGGAGCSESSCVSR